jgi:hypothetical protein
MKINIIIIVALLILSGYLAIRVYTLEYNRNLINEQQAYTIAYGKAFQQCVAANKDYDCARIAIFNKTFDDVNRVWTFDFTTLETNKQEVSSVFETRIYVNYDGSELTSQQYSKF